MNLIIDENISYRIVKLLGSSFENITHVTALKDNLLTDIEIWNYAKKNNCMIVTYDEDFYDLQLVKGFPPKLIWLRCGNAKNLIIANKLISNIDEISRLHNDENIGVIEVY